MIAPSELLSSRIDSRRDLAYMAADAPVRAVYSQALAMIPDLFSGRGYGEAIAVATKAFQVELSKVHGELERSAWQHCIDEVEQLYIDLS